MELLDLSTIVEKANVRIRSLKHPAGKLYELVNLDDLGVYEHQTIVTLHAKAATLLQSAGSLTDPQSRELAKSLGDIVRILLPGLEPAVIAELSNAKRSQIIAVWAARNEPADGDGADGVSGSGEGKARGRRTTGGSSRSSKGSTVASRKAGSTRPRG